MSPRLSNLKKVAFLFPGSGSQHVGMGKELCEKVPSVLKNIEKTEKMLGYGLRSYMFEGPERVLFPHPADPYKTIFIEVIAALSLAVADSLKGKGVHPDFVAGRSFGEFAAASFNGMYSEKDCFRILKTMLEIGCRTAVQTPSLMITIYGLDGKNTSALISEMKKRGHFCELVTRYERINLSVLGIKRHSFPLLKNLLEPLRHRVSVAREVAASHTSLFDDFQAKTLELLLSASTREPAVPMYLNYDGERHSRKKDILKSMSLGTNHRVYWEETLKNLISAGVKVFVEISPGIMLTEFICKLPKDAVVLKTDTPASFVETMDFLKKNARQ